MPSEWVGQDISIPLPSGSAEIYPSPFPAGWPTYIICLQNGSAGIYHRPSERVSRDISIPLHSGLAEIYHIPSEWVSWDISIPLHSGLAEIYPPPFRMGQLRYIHSPSQWAGRGHRIYPPLHRVGLHVLYAGL